MQLLATRRSFFTLALLFTFSSCSEPPAQDATQAVTAEQIYFNAQAYTLNPAQPWAQAFAVRDGKILAVGDESSIRALAGPNTEQTDLQGQFVMPGIIDGHAHPAWGGVTATFFCLFPSTALPAEVQTTISDCVANADPSEGLIQGGLWAAEFFNQFQIENPKAWLDDISGDKAIILKDDSGHNYWANSRALTLLQINEDSTPPAGGTYGRTADGELNGVLLEVFGAVLEALPPWTEEHYRTGLQYSIGNAHSYGVTGWKDASATETEVTAYAALDQRGELPIHVAACLVALGDDPSQVDVDGYLRLHAQYQGENLHTNFVKIFLDGIPTTSKTAAMATPYVDHEETGVENYGPLHLSSDQLSAAVLALDAAGFNIKIHAAGDRSVHEALNAIEQARTQNGSTGGRHELAHAGFILATDIPRFAQLNVVADLSPHLWFPSPIIESVRIALGERGHQYWPNRDLLDAGAPLLMGSDWPSVAPDLNPWLGLEALVTRQDPAGNFPGVGWHEQALTVSEGIEIMTMGGAKALGLEARIGSLEDGKAADFVILKHNLLKIPAEQISDTEVIATYFAGERVYSGGD